MYYSWFNITEDQNNNYFSYTWTDTSGTTTNQVLIPNGYYEISGLNAFYQRVMIANGHYLVNASGQYVYYSTITVNPTYYAVEIKNYQLPATLPTGWTNPGGVGLGAGLVTPQVIIPATNIRTLLGFNAGTYPSPAQTGTSNALSSIAPQVATVQSVILLCSILNNTLTNPSTILYSFGASATQFGTLLSVTVPELIFCDVTDGFYDFLEIQLVDQNFQPINIVDNNIVIQLVVNKSNAFELKEALSGSRF
jgi:hypothetical protein